MSPSDTRPLAQRLLHPIYRGLETRVHPLRYLFIEITQRCNLRCLHCGSDCTKDAQLDELSTDEWLAFFDDLPKHFDARELLLVVTGGEPLCCPNLDRILEALKRNQLAWGMVSNGYGLTAKRLDKLLAHGLQSVTISLDGTRAPHDWLRGVAGSFERALAAIRRVAASPIPFFDVVTCVNPRNLGELDQLQALLAEAGVREWRLFSIFPKGRALAHGDQLMLSEAQLRALLDWIAAKRRALAGTDFALQFSCEGYLPQKLDGAVRREPYFCRAGISIGSVLCDGAISGCPNISRDLVQGNIRERPLHQVWEERFAPFRDRAWMRQGVCADCAEWRRCQGNSMHLWDGAQAATARCFFRELT